MGRIAYTWISIGEDIVPQGRVDVYCYDGSDNLVAQTTSDDSGYYDLEYPPGTYTVVGETYRCSPVPGHAGRGSSVRGKHDHGQPALAAPVLASGRALPLNNLWELSALYN